MSTSNGDKNASQEVPAPRRERLPDTRRSVTHKFNVAGHEGYITVGLYKDGRPGEVFLTMAKEGSTIGGLMDAFGTAISMSLQYGVPLRAYVDKFSHTRFEPMGYTKNPDIRIAKSIIDYIFRWLGQTFLGEDNQVIQQAETNGADASTQPSSAAPTRPVTDKPADQSGPSTPRPQNGATDATLRQPVARTSPPASNGTSRRTSSNGADAQIERRDGNGMRIFSEQFARLQSDAPACDHCGSITARNGNCYLCYNCGNSMGCS